MAAPAAGRFDEQEDVVLCGPLRKDKVSPDLCLAGVLFD